MNILLLIAGVVVSLLLAVWLGRRVARVNDTLNAPWRFRGEPFRHGRLGDPACELCLGFGDVAGIRMVMPCPRCTVRRKMHLGWMCTECCREVAREDAERQRCPHCAVDARTGVA